jgi:hypothetical protein
MPLKSRKGVVGLSRLSLPSNLPGPISPVIDMGGLVSNVKVPEIPVTVY